MGNWLTKFDKACLALQWHCLSMGRQMILKWSYLMIFMKVLVAINVRWCQV